MSLISAALAALSGGMKIFSAERDKTKTKETVQLGLEIARAKDDRAAATAAKEVAKVMTEQMDDDELDDLARSLAGERRKRKRVQ